MKHPASVMVALFGFGLVLGLLISQHTERERAKPICNHYGATVYPQSLHVAPAPCDYHGVSAPCVST